VFRYDITTGKDVAEAQVTMLDSNQGGLEFDGMRIAHIPYVFIGPLLVNDLYFDYSRANDSWAGGANFQLPGSPVQIIAAPTGESPDYGFGMRHGKFDHAGGGIKFPYPPRPQLYPGVGLAEIGGAIGVNPLRFTGRLAVDYASVFLINGSAFVALATPDTAYDFPTEFAPPGLDFLAGRHLDTLSIAAGGTATINVPVIGDLPLLNAYAFYAFPDYVELGGGFKFSIEERVKLEGNVLGWVDFGDGRFDLQGKVQACGDLEAFDLCLQVAAIVSSKGIGFCALVPIGPFPTQVGIGYKWGEGLDVSVFSCNTGDFEEARPGAAAAQAGRGYRFTLPAGLPSAMVRVVSDGAPPAFELHGPKGERILAPQDDPHVLRKDAVVIPQAPEHRTLVALKRPAGGRWTITPRPGSSPIRSVATADGLRAPSVRATVRGDGRRRVLAYRVRPDAGQRVMFLELGGRTYRRLGAARGASGRIRFAPAPGRAGRREIVAQIQRGGLVVKNLVVARYTAPGTARPARPRGLRVRRTRAGLLVRWRPARGAFRYAVLVRQSTGTEAFRVTRRSRALFADINPLARGRVLVRGLRPDSAGGPAARASIPLPRPTRRGTR
jgi:hypothetical protein